MAIKTPREYRQMEFRQLLFELVCLLKPHTYVEIGVKDGWTFNKIAPLVERAVGVDIVASPVERLPHVEFIHDNSARFAKTWKDPIDFLFIDAYHECEGVLLDFYRLHPFVRPETGMIFLHDTYPVKPELLLPGYCHNAWRAAKTIREKFVGEFEIVTLPGPWAGLSILRKLKDGRHGWMDKDAFAGGRGR